jgi:hypothetical protein
MQTALWDTRCFAVFTVNMWHFEYILTPIKRKKSPCYQINDPQINMIQYHNKREITMDTITHFKLTENPQQSMDCKY